MEVVKVTKDENLKEIAYILASQTIRISVENGEDLVQMLKGIVGKTASDKRKVKEEEDRLAKLKSPEYLTMLVNAIVESYSVLSEEHVQKYLDDLVFEHHLYQCQVSAIAKLTALSEDFLEGTYEGPTKH